MREIRQNWPQLVSLVVVAVMWGQVSMQVAALRRDVDRLYSAIMPRIAKDQKTLESDLHVADKRGMKLFNLVGQYQKYADGYYRKPTGEPTTEAASVRQATEQLVNCVGNIPANSLNPIQLAKYREGLIERGNSRKTINDKMDRVRRMYKWGVAHGLVSERVLMRISTLPCLKRGRTQAHENRTIKPVQAYQLLASMREMSMSMQRLVRVHYMTGMRPSEVCGMSWDEIEATPDGLVYKPAEHKNAWRDEDRIVVLGPRVTKIITSNYATSGPVLPNKSGEYYTRCGYRCNVKNACKRAGVPIWFPGQLRHNAASRVQRRRDLESARLALGHKHIKTTQIYAERDMRELQRVAYALM